MDKLTHTQGVTPNVNSAQLKLIWDTSTQEASASAPLKVCARQNTTPRVNVQIREGLKRNQLTGDNKSSPLLTFCIGCHWETEGRDEAKSKKEQDP